MTREEAFIKLWDNKSINSLSKAEFDWILKEVFNHFEQRIVELEDISNGRHELILELSEQLKVRMNANKVLAEQLVEAESPKTCEGCKYFEIDLFENDRGSCRKPNCEVENKMLNTTFGCIGYEPTPTE